MSSDYDVRTDDQVRCEALWVAAAAVVRRLEDARLAAYLNTGEVPPICAKHNEALRDEELAHDHWLSACGKARRHLVGYREARDGS